jgi:hypothetical protein
MRPIGRPRKTEEEKRLKRKQWRDNWLAKPGVRARRSILCGARNKHNRELKRVMVNAIKAEKGCSVCGDKRYQVLDFHHKDPGEKALNVSMLISRSRADFHILNEIAKCDILCSNCHRMRHAEEKGEVG